MAKRFTQKELDRWLPTVARYTGLGLTIALTIALVLGADPTVIGPGFVPAAGLLIYKKVKEGAEE